MARSLFCYSKSHLSHRWRCGCRVNFALGKFGLLGDTSVSAVYLADNAANPGRSSGLFNGDYVAMGQINFNISDRLTVAGTYAHGYHTTGSGIFNGVGLGLITHPLMESLVLPSQMIRRFCYQEVRDQL
jgi:hypothetical protein